MHSAYTKNALVALTTRTTLSHYPYPHYPYPYYPPLPSDHTHNDHLGVVLVVAVPLPRAVLLMARHTRLLVRDDL